MKELTLQDLLNMADPSAHDSICDLWNQKTIHHLVLFTSTNDDFEIIGVGPALPYATLDDAERHIIPGKKAEYFVKCPAALAGRLLPKLAPTLGGHANPARPSLARPAAAAAPAPAKVTPPVQRIPEVPPTPALETPAPPAGATPSVKGRTIAPFVRPQIKLGAKKPLAEPTSPAPGSEAAPSTPGPEPEASTPVASAPAKSTTTRPPFATRSPIPTPSASAPTTENTPAAKSTGTRPPFGSRPPIATPPPAENPAAPKAESPNVANLEARERAIAQRERELATLSASLKIREAALRDREAALAASEDRLLNPPPNAG